jgi:tetratricopeptide (TPR) repeat protein
MVDKTVDEEVRRNYHLEMVGWLSRLMELSGDPFNWYRLGRIHLWLGNREEAKNCFASAARLLPEDSYYLQPSRKLVKDLSQ